jgi:hypothetical protein
MARKVKKRSVLKPRDVLFIDEGQVLRIVEQTFPDRLLSLAQLKQLESGVNFCLSALHSPVNPDEIPDVSEVKRTLSTLKRILNPKRLWFLEAVGRAYQRRHDPVRGYMFLDDTVRTTVEELSRTTKKILSWLQDDKSSSIVVGSLKPAARLDDVIAKFLPLLFETVFAEKAGVSRTGPYTKFITAVLREAGIRSRNDSDDTIAEAIKMARYRYKKRQRD